MPANLNRKQQREIKAVVERAKKDNGIPQTAQQSIPFQRMFPDGICRVTDSYYTKTIQFQDINYQLAQQEDKTAIFDEWCSFLNFFDSSIHFELSFMNLSTDAESFEKSIRIPFKKDSFNPVRAEYSQMLKKQLAQGNNGLTKTKYLTFGIEAESMRQAKPRLNHIENDLLNNFRRLGVIATTMNGKERLHLMHSMFHMGDNDKFFFDWKYLVESGLSVKDFIAPTAFAFKTNRTFQMGSIFGSMSYLAITASDLSDRMLADFLDMESTQIVTMHIQSVDQTAAIKTIKRIITELDRSKIEEQKKAVRSGYDMDIIPSDLATYGKDAKSLLKELQSQNERMASRGAAVTLTSKAHRAVSEYEDDNIGVQAVQETTKAVESTVYTVDHAVYSHKLKAYDKAEKLVEKSDKANVNALYEKFKKDNPDAGSNPFSRWQQKRAIKKEYAAAKAGKNTASTTASASKGAGKATGKAAQGAKNITERVTEFCTTHSKTILFVLIAGLLFMILSGMFSSCSAMFQGGTQIILGTSFTAKEEDIIGADNDYKALEAALRNKINNIERTHSGYDEYRYDLDEINHNPYELAAYLTVKFEDYTRDEVQATLQWLFEQQYELTLTEVVEIRTRTTSSTDPETGETTTEEEDYEYYILNVKLRNKGLNSVISNSGLSEDDMERYRILLQTRGNRPDIFGNDIYATPGGEYTDYDIPGEALTDTRFANMIREAEKYLGYPYVWGGSSPSTSFDCSGFVSYVINHCGNGWSVGRLTANGLMGVCDIIPKSSAKPGDLIFFQGTYDTSGASHVGIYVGNGMMIHCGNPISYASIESNYWQQHFYCFGRIRN